MPPAREYYSASTLSPAPGSRYTISGALLNVGNTGFSWSSATSGIDGLDLSFSSQNLTPNNSNNRSHGFQLRCLSE